jgi:anti-sigma-K factor RskA
VNIKEYISSGIVESYVLGLTTDAERQEFETMCTQYPELVQARMQFEDSLEKKLMAEAVMPPAFLKEKIEAAVQPGSATLHTDTYEEEEAPVRKINNWQWIAAASILLFVGSLAWALYLNGEKNELASSNQQLRQQLDETKPISEEVYQMAAALKKPGLKMAALHGTPASPASLAAVYYDTTSHDVYLIVNNLPQPPSDQQYQLWALIDKQPVDLGVFELKQEKLVVKMKNVNQAQAFAITLEPKGGSASPTMTAMHTYGKL